jgi:hypothetical protein
MAVPSSGMLSLFSIRRELGINNYNGYAVYSNVGLYSCSIGQYGTINTANSTSDRPDTLPPHQMSEFYSYDHDKVSVTAFTANGSPNNSQVCGNSPDTTFYHDGSGTLPTTGDTVYTNSAGTTLAGAGFLATSTSGGIQLNDDSAVSNTYTCEEKKK